jgi:hypothetical protein
MRYIVLSIDTNGIPNNNFDSIDTISISALEIDFSSLEKIQDEFFYIVKDSKVNDSTKYHGFTQNDVDEYGTPLEEIVEELGNYLFKNNEDVNFDEIVFICTAAASFTIPIIENMFKKFDIDVKITKYIDVLHATHLLINSTYMDEVYDIFGIKIPSKNSINKVNALVATIHNMRELCQ